MKSINILLVEDNEGDILLTKEALAECKIVNHITIKRDGQTAVEYFENLTDQDAFPGIVLLDINLPKMNGQEVLLFIKNHERFMHIPVIILTTSSAEKDILASYKNHVNCYITKPIDVVDFVRAITKIEEFWINIVSIPNK